MISIEQVHSFTQVYQHGSYSAAARAIGKERSTIREHVVTLEDTLGIELFQIQGRTATPTAAAEKLIARAINLSKQAEDFSLTAFSLFDEPLETLVIFYDALIPVGILTNAITKIRAQFTHISIDCIASSRSEAYKRIEKGDCHIAIMATENSPRTQARIASTYIGTIPIACYCSPCSPLADKKEISMNDLRLEHQYRLQMTQDGDLASFHISNNIDKVGSLDLAIDLLQECGWIALTKSIANKWVKSQLLTQLEIADATRDYRQGVCLFYGLANHTQDEISFAIKALDQSASDYLE